VTPVAEPILFCWSGGKDSCLALNALRNDPRFQVASLLSTITEGYDRLSMHGVRRALIERQAASLGLPLDAVTIPPACVNPIYESRMEAALLRWKQRGVRRVAFGDIFLEDLRAYRERNLARVNMEAVFPIWRRPTSELARDFLRLGFRGVTVCVDPRVLDESFAGCEMSEEFFARLPAAADPCGENGEFHSFVFDGPGFAAPVGFRHGETVLRDGFYFRDLIPAGAGTGETI
jgi:uncharacterized protein (TIGR00290 family)